MHLKGYNGTGVQEIVEAAGVPKGSFYNYFQSKEHFAGETLQYFGDRFLSKAEPVLQDDSIPPLQKIDLFFSGLIHQYIQQYQFTMGCYAGNMCQEMADVNEVLRVAVEEVFKRISEPLKQCLKAAQDAGDLSPAHDINRLAEFIINSYEGAVLRMKSSRNAEPLLTFKNMLFDVILK